MISCKGLQKQIHHIKDENNKKKSIAVGETEES